MCLKKDFRLRSKKHKNVSATLNYIEHFLILASPFTWCISISAFASLVPIPKGITTSVIGLKICAITTGLKTYIIQKKKHVEIVLLAKTKINNIEVLINIEALTDSNINYD